MSPPKFPSFTNTFHSDAYPALDPSLPELSAAGKNVVVTGGGTGIGRATALRFAQAGALSVSILGRRLEALEECKANIERTVGQDVKVHTYAADIANPEDVKAAFVSIKQTLGPTHILINNAGYIPTPSPIISANVNEWSRGLDINMKGTFLATQAFLQNKVDDDAVVIFVSTGLTHIAKGLNNSSYAASKAGAVRFMTSVQLEHPEVRTYCLHPGMVMTDSLKKSQGGVAAGGDDESLPAGTMTWLASREATFLKGRYIWANWDVDEMKSRAKDIEGSDLLAMKLGGWPFV